MGTDTPKARSLHLSPNVARLLAVGWVAALSFVYLFRYEAWVYPLQLAQVAFHNLPALRFGPHFGHFVGARLLDLLCVAGILATAFPVGAIIVERFTTERNLLTGLFAVALGLWVAAMAVLAVGAFSTRGIPGVFVLAVCWALPEPRKFFHKTKLGRLDGWAKLMLVLIVVAAGLNLLGALTPPFEYDELEYHLGAPAEYLKAGRIVFLPHNFYSNLPQLTEMLYLLAMVARSSVTAKLLHWSFGLLAAVAVYAVASRLWSRRVAWLASAMLYAVPFVQDLSQTARIDLATAFFAALAFGALLAWREPKSRDNWLALSALAAGAAVATKWPAVAVVLLPAVEFTAACRRSLRPGAKYWWAVLPVVPWLVKNWWLTGNPVYPLFYEWFGSPHWSAGQSALFAEKHYPTWGSVVQAWHHFPHDLVLLAWRFHEAVLFVREHHSSSAWFELMSLIDRGWHHGVNDLKLLASILGIDKIWRYSFVEAGAVPVLLMSVPLVLLVRRADRRAQQAAWLFVAAYVGWWAGTFRPWRFLFPAFPVAALVGAYALDAVGKWARVAVAAVLVVGLATMGLTVLVDVEQPERVPAEVSFTSLALGRISDNELTARIGKGMFEPVVWMNQNLPATARVLYIGEARVALARHRVVWATAYDQHPVLRALTGVTHVYINFSEWERLRTHYGYLLDFGGNAFRQFLQEHGRLVHEYGRSKVYELTP